MYTLRLLTLLLSLYVTHAGNNLAAEYKEYCKKYGHCDGPDQKRRVVIYTEQKRKIEEHNKDPSSPYKMGVNEFTGKTAAERHLYGGAGNLTDIGRTRGHVARRPRGRLLLSKPPNPASVDNLKLGYVTRPKHQRSCGCCWAFAAAAAFEGAYARATGVRKSFSEKELLDCTYESEQGRDGCVVPGRPNDAWDYLERVQRLATLEDAPYDYARDRGCNYGAVPNGIKNARFKTWEMLGRYASATGVFRATDSEIEEKLGEAVLSVGIILDDTLWSYAYGLYYGCPDRGIIGHYVALVGYDPDSWNIKNSWGRDWGMAGFALIDRSKHNNCRLNDFPAYAVVTPDPRGEPDTTDPPWYGPVRTRAPDKGCTWGDDYPCSDMNCNYGCGKKNVFQKKCWRQCNGRLCSGSEAGPHDPAQGQRCKDNCREWCWMGRGCRTHEDCAHAKHDACAGSCSTSK